MTTLEVPTHKICTGCHELKNIQNDFHQDSSKLHGRIYCKQCCKTNFKEYSTKISNETKEVTEKLCVGCDTVKLANEFVHDSTNKIGKISKLCKVCTSKSRIQTNQRNADNLKANPIEPETKKTCSTCKQSKFVLTDFPHKRDNTLTYSGICSVCTNNAVKDGIRMRQLLVATYLKHIMCYDCEDGDWRLYRPYDLNDDMTKITRIGFKTLAKETKNTTNLMSKLLEHDILCEKCYFTRQHGLLKTLNKLVSHPIRDKKILNIGMCGTCNYATNKDNLYLFDISNNVVTCCSCEALAKKNWIDIENPTTEELDEVDQILKPYLQKLKK